MEDNPKKILRMQYTMRGLAIHKAYHHYMYCVYQTTERVMYEVFRELKKGKNQQLEGTPCKNNAIVPIHVQMLAHSHFDVPNQQRDDDFAKSCQYFHLCRNVDEPKGGRVMI